MTKRVFMLTWDDDLGPMWMNKDNLSVCIQAVCIPEVEVEDITDDVFRIPFISYPPKKDTEDKSVAARDDDG